MNVEHVMMHEESVLGLWSSSGSFVNWTSWREKQSITRLLVWILQ